MIKFIETSKKIIAGYFKHHILNKNISFTDIYPIEIQQEETDYNEEMNIHLKLSDLYEQLLPTNLRKDYGKFYTNDNKVIELMLNECNVLSGNILEPSCGTGLFLVAIINCIESQMRKKGCTAEEILNYITEHIHGNDIDCFVLTIAEINLLSTLLPLVVEAVNNNNNYRMHKLKLYNYDFTKKNITDKKFDLIIGNPPFVTLYGRRSRNMTEIKRAYYNTFDFVQNKKGNNKFNICMFFIENGLKYLSPNGVLYFILDITFFETAFIDLRRYIVKNYFIESVTKGLKEFTDVASGQILLKILNQSNMNTKIKFTNYDKHIIKFVNQHIWDNENNDFKYIEPFEGIDKEIITKINKFNKLDYYYPNKALRTCCVLTGRTDDFIVDPNNECSFDIYPYIEGSKGLSSKFGHLKGMRYIKYDYDLQIKISDEFKRELEIIGVKNKKRVTLGDKEVYDAPKIFIRQSALEIITTYTEKPYAANNSIYVLSNKDYSDLGKKRLKYVCGILNSDLITYYCRVRNIIRIEKGKTPQIKISDLKEVRICYNEKVVDEFVEIVDKLLLTPSIDKKLLEKLNQIVYSMYGITEDEIKYIKNYIAN